MTPNQSRDLEPVRSSAVAGSWYPDDPEVLAREVDGYLDAAEPSLNTDVSALIAPHAGLMYSGPVGAYAYRAVQGLAYDVAVLIGPSHHIGFEGVSTYPRGSFATPFGICPVDEEVATRLLEGSDSVIDYPRAHVREHSLEMQLPFLCRVLPDTPIVPLVMGFQTRETIIGLAETLATTLQGVRALLVASTDLSHYFDAEHAARLDARVVELVNRFDGEGLLKRFSRPYYLGRSWYFCAYPGGPTMDLRDDSDAGCRGMRAWVRLLKQRRRDTEVAPRVQRQGRRACLSRTYTPWPR